MPQRIGSYTNALSNAPARTMRKASYAAQIVLNSAPEEDNSSRAQMDACRLRTTNSVIGCF